MRIRLALAAACLLALTTTTPALAAFQTAVPVDGPSPDVLRVGDVDMARDGNGVAAYIRRDGGVDHVLASRFVGGAFAPPERVDARPRDARHAGGGRGLRRRPLRRRVHERLGRSTRACATSARPAGPRRSCWPTAPPTRRSTCRSTAWPTRPSPSTATCAPRAWPATRATFIRARPAAGHRPGRRRPASAPGARASRSPPTARRWRRWGENGHVYARRLFDANVSAAPQDLTLARPRGPPGRRRRRARRRHRGRLELRAGSSSARPSPTAPAAADARDRPAPARLACSRPPSSSTASAWGGESVDQPDIDISGRGVGLASVGTALGRGRRRPAQGRRLQPRAWPSAAAGSPSHPVGATAETIDRVRRLVPGPRARAPS